MLKRLVDFALDDSLSNRFDDRVPSKQTAVFCVVPIRSCFQFEFFQIEVGGHIIRYVEVNLGFDPPVHISYLVDVRVIWSLLAHELSCDQKFSIGVIRMVMDIIIQFNIYRLLAIAGPNIYGTGHVFVEAFN